MTDELVRRLEVEADRLRADYVCAAHAMDDARDRIEALLAERQWQPIETAPKDGTPVLLAVRNGDRRLVGEAWFNPFTETSDGPDGAWWWANESSGEYHADAIYMRWTITHWMPLPAPPAEPQK